MSTGISSTNDDILIIGAGIGGLTLGLMLHRRGIPCRVFEAAPEIKPLGVGINLLPHAMKEMAALGLEDTLAARGVRTQEAAFYNRFGQLIHKEPLGRAAGYDWPQISIHPSRKRAQSACCSAGNACAWKKMAQPSSSAPKRAKRCRRSVAAPSSAPTAFTR